MYPFLLVLIALMISVYLRMKGIDNDKVNCPIDESFRSLAMFMIIVVSLHLILLSWETLWLLKFLIVRATNKCKSRENYYYESSDEEDDRKFFEVPAY